MWVRGRASRQGFLLMTTTASSGTIRRPDRSSTDGTSLAEPAQTAQVCHPGFELSVPTHGGRVVLGLVGDLDAFTASRFSDRVGSLVAAGARSVVFDLGGVDVVDARGVEALVRSLDLLRCYHGEMILRSVRSDTLRRLGSAGVTDRFPIC